jgi:hypothetical protein
MTEIRSLILDSAGIDGFSLTSDDSDDEPKLSVIDGGKDDEI